MRRPRTGRSAAEDAAYDLLIDLGFPLPLDAGAVRRHLGLEIRQEALPQRVRGLLLVPERLIVVRRGLGPHAEAHVVLHECGHHRLPEHKALLYRCSIFDLDPRVRRRMEAEANAFATVLRFGPVPDGWVDAEPPSIERVHELADMAGASFESALRWFVAETERPVWALVCDAPPAGRDGPGTTPMVRVRYGYRSPTATPRAWPAVVPAGLPPTRSDWAPELSGYRTAGATAAQAWATAYSTCVLLWG